MTDELADQTLDPDRTTWHITFGTYGTRLHGGARSTVDKKHNQRNESFVSRNSYQKATARSQMKFPPQ